MTSFNILIYYKFLSFKTPIYKLLIIILKNWGLGIGDWGLGIGDWAQSPIPNPHKKLLIKKLKKLKKFKKLKKKINLILNK